MAEIIAEFVVLFLLSEYPSAKLCETARLHLLGYDHYTQDRQDEMWSMQEEISAKILGRVQ